MTARDCHRSSCFEMQPVGLVRSGIDATVLALASVAISGLLLGSSVRAGVYYVDIGSGSNSNMGTSTNAPWKHLPGTVGQSGSGWVVLKDGDTVYVKGGTTNNVQARVSTSWYNGNQAFDSIKIISGHLAASPWGSGRAIFDEQSGNTYGLWVGNLAHGITVDGFEVRNIKAGGAGLGFDDVNGSSCILVGGSGNPGSSHIKIRRCYLHDALRDADDRGHGIETDSVSDLVVEYNIIGPNIGTKGIEAIVGVTRGDCNANYISTTGDHAIVISGQNWDVRNNVINRVGPFVHDPVYAIKITGNNNDIWNNLCYRNDPVLPSPLTDRPQGIGLFRGRNNRLFHNSVYNFANSPNGHEFGVGISLGDENQSAANNLVENNLVLNCRNLQGRIQFYIYSACVSNTVSYNCFFGSSATEVTVNYNDGTFYNVDQFNTNALNNANIADFNVQLDPQWKRGTLPNGLDAAFRPNVPYFQLTTGTPAPIQITRNALAGTATNGYSSAPNKFAADILGASRTVWSMGAYEYGGIALPPAPPTNLRVVPGK